MEYSLFNDPAVAKVLYHDPFEDGRRHTGVPHALRIHDNDGTASAHPQAWRFAPFDPRWPEQQVFALEEGREVRIEPPAVARR